MVVARRLRHAPRTSWLLAGLIAVAVAELVLFNLSASWYTGDGDCYLEVPGWTALVGTAGALLGGVLGAVLVVVAKPRPLGASRWRYPAGILIGLLVSVGIFAGQFGTWYAAHPCSV